LVVVDVEIVSSGAAVNTPSTRSESAGIRDAVTKALPPLCRVVNRDDCPTVGRRAGRVEDLAVRQQAAGVGVRRRERSLVLLLCPIRELVNDAD
jgi:hypothetical protein